MVVRATNWFSPKAKPIIAPNWGITLAAGMLITTDTGCPGRAGNPSSPVMNT